MATVNNVPRDILGKLSFNDSRILTGVRPKLVGGVRKLRCPICLLDVSGKDVTVFLQDTQTNDRFND